MNDEELLLELLSQNPWWNGKNPDLPIKVTERVIFSNLVRELDEKEVTIVIGLRSVGKTTILKQLIQTLMTRKIELKHVLYFSFDNLKNEERIISKILTLYSTHVLKKPISDVRGKLYLFFDEIQKIDAWGEEIKVVYDKKLPVKVVVSGSSSANILKGSGESLVGRSIIYKLRPFSFVEFLKFKKVNVESTNVWNLTYPSNADAIKILFHEFTKIGGFPSLYENKDERLKPLLKSALDLTLYRDLITIFEVKRPDVLEGLFYFFTKETSNIINYANASSSLKTKFETIKSYCEYLNSAFLINKSHLYTGSKMKSLEKNEKIYIADHAFGILEEIEIGKKMESIVFNFLKSSEIELNYWQDYKRNEVDIIATVEKEVIPIEVKYQNQISNKDFQNVTYFLNEHKLKKGIIVTKNHFEVKTINNKEIHCIPAWLFLTSKFS